MEFCHATGKVCHKTRSSAQQTVSHIRRKNRASHRRTGHLTVFRCESCGYFHFGHTVGKNKRYFPQHRE